MKFSITETVYRVSLGQGTSVESSVEQYLQKHGYRTIHHDFYLFHDSEKTKYPENEQTLNDIIGQEKLTKLREYAAILYPWGLGPGQSPEQPDIFAYDADRNYFFSEVKSRRTGDRLRPPQMIGLSLIHVILGCDLELALAVDKSDQKGINPKRYEWVWPAVQDSGFINIELRNKNYPTSGSTRRPKAAAPQP
jgi:hypothetical protein